MPITRNMANAAATAAVVDADVVPEPAPSSSAAVPSRSILNDNAVPTTDWEGKYKRERELLKKARLHNRLQASKAEKASKKARADSNRQLGMHKSKLQQQTAANVQLQSKYNTLELQLKKYAQRDLVAWKRYYYAKVQQYNQLSTQNAQLQSEHAKLQSGHTTLQSQNATLQWQLANQNAQLQYENRMMQSETARLHTENWTLRSTNGVLQSQQMGLPATFSELWNQNEALFSNRRV